MAKLSTLQPSDIREVAIPVGDGEESLNLKIDASAFTIGWEARVTKASESNDIAGFSREFFSLVKEWDLEDEDGNIYPLTQETMELFSIHVFSTIVQAIRGSILPNVEAPRKSRKR